MMAVSSRPSQAQFYREFLMARSSFDPADYGVSLNKDDFTDQMIEELRAEYRGQMTIDELLLRPREAMRFCDSVRHKHGYYDMPDEGILRVILGRRKNPNG